MPALPQTSLRLAIDWLALRLWPERLSEFQEQTGSPHRRRARYRSVGSGADCPRTQGMTVQRVVEPQSSAAPGSIRLPLCLGDILRARPQARVPRAPHPSPLDVAQQSPGAAQRSPRLIAIPSSSRMLIYQHCPHRRSSGRRYALVQQASLLKVCLGRSDTSSLA
jgi:hypothetical protein